MDWSCISHTLTPSQKAARDADKDSTINLPAGIDTEFFAVFREMISGAKKFGYDPTNHFRECELLCSRISLLSMALSDHFSVPPDRRGTFTTTKYQHRGFGSWLTRHCNAIVDAEGAATFVNVRPASKRMFERLGFNAVETSTFDLRLYGGDTVDETVTLKREPQ